MTDPIADMLTRIRNAQLARKAEVVLPFSKIKLKIAEILQAENYISSVTLGTGTFPELKIVLKYQGKTPVIRSITRASKVGRRLYAGRDHLPTVLNGLGIALVSTSRGIMTGREAKKLGVGGEVICEVY
jgi:small subunit ribosomal protein S8